VDHTEKYKNSGKVRFTPVSTAWLLSNRFPRDIQLLNSNKWRSKIPNFIEIGQQIWKVGYEFIYGLKVRLSLEDFHKTHACSTDYLNDLYIEIHEYLANVLAAVNRSREGAVYIEGVFFFTS
jgi:hypothetical protein